MKETVSDPATKQGHLSGGKVEVALIRIAVIESSEVTCQAGELH